MNIEAVKLGQMRKAFRLVVVLGYHDLVPSGQVHSWLQVDVDNFERQLRLCKRIGSFIRPEALFDPTQLRRDRINFLLTFDDGFVNTFHLGLPLLKKHNVPALFFVSTAHMLNGEPFWFDRIIEPLQRYRLTELDLRRHGLAHYRFNPGDGEPRWSGIQTMLEDIKRCDEAREEELAGRIADQLKCQIEESGVAFEHFPRKPLNDGEIRQMQNSGLCNFGSHAHHHGILTGLAAPDLMNELNTSRNVLEGLLQQPVTAIGYPNGDNDERVRQACRNAGYRLGFTATAARVDHDTDRLNIPRLQVGGYDSSLRFMWNLARTMIRGFPTGVEAKMRAAQRGEGA